MLRFRTYIALSLLATAACSPKAPPAGEAPKMAKEAPPPVDKAAAQAAVGTGVVTPPPPADPREETLSQAVVELLEHKHLLRPHIDDTLSKTAFATYVDRLDSGKMFLLQSDRDSLNKYADKIDDELRAGNLELAHEGAKLYATRVAVIEKVVNELLVKPMDFSNDEYFELDAKKVKPAATEDELKERWRQRLELEVLESVSAMELRLKSLADLKANKKSSPETIADAEKAAALVPATPEAREQKAREDIAKTYAGRFARLRTPSALDAAADVVNAVTSALDPHTDYLAPAEKANFDIAMSGTLEGIGARLQEKDHYIEVMDLVPGGASQRAGTLLVGDTIMSVENEGTAPVDTFDMPIDDVVHMIRGPKGTVVKLRIQRQGAPDATVAITRDKVVIEETYARAAILQKKGLRPFGYIHLPGFYGSRDPNDRQSGDDVAYLLGEMQKKKITGVILDLRSNGGGLLDEAVNLTDALIDQGPVVEVRDYDKKIDPMRAKTAGEAYDGKLIVLVDRFSASASEIVAGALQDYKRGIIVGTSAQTHGKGTVQTVIDLDRLTNGQIELGELKMTIQQFFRPSGSSTQMLGVVPDIVLPDPNGWIDSGEKTLEHPIAWSQIERPSFSEWATKYDVAKLQAASTARVAKNPILAKVATTTELLRARQQDTRVPLNKTAWETRRKEQTAALEAASPDMAKAPVNFTVTMVEDNPKFAKPAEAPPVPPPSPKPGDKTDKDKAFDPTKTWRDSLARDPWLDECLSILNDEK